VTAISKSSSEAVKELAVMAAGAAAAAAAALFYCGELPRPRKPRLVALTVEVSAILPTGTSEISRVSSN